MASYRLYFISAADRILAAENFEADSDEAAIGAARRAAAASHEAGFELWQGSRFILKEVPATA
jgi:hypothetical protein